MLKIPELAMPQTRKVMTVCNGKKEVWEDREEAKDFFIRQTMITEGKERRGMKLKGQSVLEMIFFAVRRKRKTSRKLNRCNQIAP